MEFQITPSEDLCRILDERQIAYETIGTHRDFCGPAPLDDCMPQNLTWSGALSRIALTVPACVVVLPKGDISPFRPLPDKLLIVVDHPRNVFRLILSDLYAQEVDLVKGLLDETMFESFGSGRMIAHSASVSKDAILGKNVIIHPSVAIYPGVQIGDNVEIAAGCVIGAPGFGHVRQQNGRLEPFPHIGGVSIGNNVSIGSNTCVDCGGLTPTTIHDGVRIGNLTQIAHNVEIEKDCLIGTRCQIAGGTKIGQGTEIWAGVTISNKRRIGRFCSIKIGSVVITHLPDGSVVSGNFAIPHNRNLEIYEGLRDPI